MKYPVCDAARRRWLLRWDDRVELEILNRLLCCCVCLSSDGRAVPAQWSAAQITSMLWLSAPSCRFSRKPGPQGFAGGDGLE